MKMNNNESRSKRKKKIIKLVICLSVVAVIASVATLAAVLIPRSKYNPNEKYFDPDTFKDIYHICSISDRAALQPVLDEIDEAFSYFGTSSDCEEKFGELARFCICTDTHPDAVREEHTIEFITGNISGNSGYVWFTYRQIAYDKVGGTTYGAWDIPTRVAIEKIDGVWKATEVDEAP